MRICLRAVDDLDANCKATMIITKMNTRDDAFVELTRSGGVTVLAADRPYRKALL